MPSNNYIYKMSNAGGMSTVTRYTDMLAGNAAFVQGNYESIATITGPAGAATFTSIPSTYQHLQIRYTVRGSRSLPGEQLYIRLNGDSGSNYSYHGLYATSGGVNSIAAASSNVYLIQEFPAANDTANVYTTGVIDILDYKDTNKNKTMRGLGGYDNNNSGVVNASIWYSSSAWLNTNAITSISILSNGPFASASSFALYGIS